MITVLRAHGLHIAIYTDDHPPPHVHVLGDGELKVQLVQGGRPVLLHARGMKSGDIRKAMHAIAAEQDLLLRIWSELHV